MRDKLTLIDMFSGAGGLSEGFFRAGFDIVSHIEMNKYAAMSLETRALFHFLNDNKLEKEYYAYLNGAISRKEFFENNEEFSAQILVEEISEDNVNSLIKMIEQRMADLSIKKIDGIVGGPPCQAYSHVGRARCPNSMKADQRNYLYNHYINFLKHFRPNFFVFENVPGMKDALNGEVYRDFQQKLEKLNYGLYDPILNAKNFGVPQSRERLIVIGQKADEYSEIQFGKEKPEGKVQDHLRDLPKLQPGEGTDDVQEYRKKYKNPPKLLEKKGIRTKKDSLIHHKARNHNDTDRKIYREVINIWRNEKRRMKYNELPEELKSHRNTRCFQDRFKVVAGDLDYSHTIVAHIAKDGHYHIHYDPDQGRSITVREAARLQSFPDNYKFEGSRTSQYTQIGNAVPPLMAEKIAYKILEIAGG